MQEKHLTSYQALSLLFWQYLVLAAVLGVFFRSFPFHAGLSLGLLFFFLGMHYQDKRLFRLVLVCAVFLLAFAYTVWREPSQSAESKAYYQEYFNPLQEENGELCGKIEYVQGMSDGRLRVLLSHVHRKEENLCNHTELSELTEKSLQGNVVLTLYQSSDTVDTASLHAALEKRRPVAGQFLQAKAALRPFHGVLQQYYGRQNAWYGARLYGKNYDVKILGEGNFWSNVREDLRLAFVRVLFADEWQNNTPKNQEKTAIQSALATQDTSPGSFVNSPASSYAVFEGQAKAILLALLFGDKFYLTQDTLDSFSKANLSHSLALSGQHLSLVGVLACFFLFFVSWLKPRIYLYVPKYHLFVFMGLVFGFLYCWLGSSPYSLLRAYAMASLAGLLYVRARHCTLLDLLFYALALFICFNPLALYQLGVQLSFCSVFTIAFCLPLLRYLHGKYFTGFRPFLRKIFFFPFSLLLISCAVQIVISPLLLLYFGQISWFSLLNIVWLPLLAFWVIPVALLGFLCAGFSFAPSILSLAYEPVVFFIAGLKGLTEFFPLQQGIRPMGLACLGFYLLLLLCVFSLQKWTQKSRVFLTLAIFFLFVPVFLRFLPFGQGVQLILFDVGNGQAVFLRTKEKKLLIDVGGISSKRFNAGRDIVAKKLTQNAFPHFDYLIASHDDADHINGIAPIVQAFPVRAFYETSCKTEKQGYAKKALDTMLSRSHIPVIPLGMGDFLDLGGGYGLEVLYPPKMPVNTPLKVAKNPWALAKYSRNNSSLILRLVKNGHGIALFCGDSEAKAIAKLVAMHEQNIHSLQADILILPHHGSQNSYSEKLYELVRPRYVLASCSAYNHFQFPAQKVREYFIRNNIPLLTTAEHGDIVFMHEEGQEGQIILGKKTFLQACYSIL